MGLKVDITTILYCYEDISLPRIVQLSKKNSPVQCVCVFVCVCVFLSVSMHACMCVLSVSMHACMCVCM